MAGVVDCSVYMKEESGVDWVAGKLEEGLDFRVSEGFFGFVYSGSFLLLWIQAASSFRGLEQLPPSVDSTTSSNICPGALAILI